MSTATRKEQKMKIIDFHTHPFILEEDNIKRYKEMRDGTDAIIWEDKRRAGIDIICGAVLHVTGETSLENMRVSNAHALQLAGKHPGEYVPGILINPNFIDESCAEIDKARAAGTYLIGESNPRRMDFKAYSVPVYIEILEYGAEKGMIVSCHSTTEDDMNALCEAIPQMPMVFAHPGEQERVEIHIERMRKYENAYLDLSGTGLFRFGMLRYLIDKVGKDRILFGTDYPICNPAMYVHGVLYEKLRDDEYEAIFYKNAERLLRL